MKKEEEKVPPYCVRYKGLFTFKTFDEAAKKLSELSEKYSSEDFDEVLVNISLGRNCIDRERCRPCIFRKKNARKTWSPHNSNKWCGIPYVWQTHVDAFCDRRNNTFAQHVYLRIGETADICLSWHKVTDNYRNSNNQSQYLGLWVGFPTPKTNLQTFIRPLYGFGFSYYLYKNNIRSCLSDIWKCKIVLLP